MKLIEKIRERRHEKRFTVTCPECHESFNAEKQTGICPHESLDEFLSKPVANSITITVNSEGPTEDL